MSSYKFATFEFYPERHVLVSYKNASAVELLLEPQVSRLLTFCLEHPDEVLTRDVLMASLWQGIVEESSVNQAVAKLRKALGDEASRPRFIETVSKQGYRFLVTAERRTEVSVKKLETINAMTRSSHKFIVSVLVLIAFSFLFWLVSSWQSQSSKLPLVGQLRPLTSLSGQELAPARHSKKKLLLFAHRPEADGHFDLVLKNGDGETINLTLTNNATEIRAAWSNSGQMLAWTEFKDGQCQIKYVRWTNDVESGKAPLKGDKLAECSLYDIQLAWAKDDQYLYFNRHAWQGGPLRVYRVRLSDKLISEVSDAPDNYVGDVAFGVNKDTLLLARTQHWNSSHLVAHHLSDENTRQHATLPYWIKELAPIKDTPLWLYAQAPDYRNIMTFNMDSGRSDLVTRTDDFVADIVFDDVEGSVLFSRYRFDSDLVQMFNPVMQETKSKSPDNQVLVSSSRRNWFPVFEDTKQALYYFSDRTGQTQIWRKTISDGTEKQLTTFDEGFRPWRMNLSPDGSKLTFDGSDNRLYILDTHSLVIRPLTDSKLPDYNPTWRDNDNIVFARKQTNDWWLLNFSLMDGETTVLNLPGAFSARLAADQNGGGYYSHVSLPGFWKVEEGKAQQIFDKGSAGPFNQWHLGRKGIYYLASHEGRLAIWHYDFEEQTHRVLHKFKVRNYASFWVSQDEHTIIVSKARNLSSDIWSVELN